MPNLSQDLVIIQAPSPTISGMNHPIYSVHYIRVLGEQDVDELLDGKLLDDVEPSHVLLKGEILPQLTGSVKEAADLVKAILSDAGSEPRRAGLAPNTPIYHGSPGERLLPA